MRRSHNTTLHELRDLLEICSLIYDPIDALKIRLNLPRYWQVEHKGRGHLHFSHSKKVRTTPMPAAWTPPEAAVPQSSAPTKPSRKESSSTTTKQKGVPRVIFKHKPKKQLVGHSGSLGTSRGLSKPRKGSISRASSPATFQREDSGGEGARPKLVLKLSTKPKGRG
jgi:transcription initiation factor TFIID subunit 2